MFLALLLPLLLKTAVSAVNVEEELLETVSQEEGLTQEEIRQLGPMQQMQEVPLPGKIGEMIKSALEASGLLSFRSGLRTAAILLAAVLAGSILPQDSQVHRGLNLACAAAIVGACATDLHAMIGLGTETVRRIGQYAAALVPGLCTLMAAAGCISSGASLNIFASAALNLFSSLCTSLLVPMIYALIGLSVADTALGLAPLEKLRSLMKGICTGLLKLTVSSFTALLATVGCFSAAADASKVKAAKIAISGMIPMVGGAVSNASESLLNAALMLKASVGTYGMLAVLGMFFTPFLKIGAQYLLLKGTAALCGLFGNQTLTGLIDKLSQAMGLVLAMTGVICMMAIMSFALCVHTVAS